MTCFYVKLVVHNMNLYTICGLSLWTLLPIIGNIALGKIKDVELLSKILSCIHLQLYWYSLIGSIKLIHKLQHCTGNSLAELKNVETSTCLSRCKTCNNHGKGTCADYCSKFNYCGKAPIYRPNKGGTDCRGCGKNILYFYTNSRVGLSL